jgi:hypothetical protein
VAVPPQGLAVVRAVFGLVLSADFGDFFRIREEGAAVPVVEAAHVVWVVCFRGGCDGGFGFVVCWEGKVSDKSLLSLEKWKWERKMYPVWLWGVEEDCI